MTKQHEPTITAEEIVFQAISKSDNDNYHRSILEEALAEIKRAVEDIIGHTNHSYPCEIGKYDACSECTEAELKYVQLQRLAQWLGESAK